MTIAVVTVQGHGNAGRKKMLKRINGKRRRDLGYDAHEFALQRVHPGAPLKIR